jgi:hypothetical protein
MSHEPTLVFGWGHGKLVFFSVWIRHVSSKS